MSLAFLRGALTLRGRLIGDAHGRFGRPALRASAKRQARGGGLTEVLLVVGGAIAMLHAFGISVAHDYTLAPCAIRTRTPYASMC